MWSLMLLAAAATANVLVGVTAQTRTAVYVTDLSLFTYLTPCAASAVSQNTALQTMGGGGCEDLASDAAGLQSSVCLQPAMSATVLSSLSSNGRLLCYTSIADSIASATAVFAYYCSAARAEATPTGIVISCSGSGSGSGNAHVTFPDETSAASAPLNGSGKSNKGVIIGAVVGSVAGILLVVGIAVLVSLYKRGARRQVVWEEGQQEEAQRKIAQRHRALELSSIATKVQTGAPATTSTGSKVAAADDTISPVADADEAAPPAYEAGSYGVMYPVQK